jgi:hypothetical protein
MPDLRFPIGKFAFEGPVSEADLHKLIDNIGQTPSNLRAAVKALSEKQLDTPYRPEGWTVRQVVHHMPDSHVNAYVRLKLALTEDQIKSVKLPVEMPVALNDVSFVRRPHGRLAELSYEEMQELAAVLECTQLSFLPTRWREKVCPRILYCWSITARVCPGAWSLSVAPRNGCSKG